MSVVYNARGTSVPFFTIGKQGVTIFQGSADPQLTYTIKNGDIWINDSTHAISSWYSGTSSWGPPAAGYLNFPLTDGTSGQVLATNALGQLSFVSTVDNVTGIVAIANGGTGQTTANAAFNALAPSQTGNEGKFLSTDGTNTVWAALPATVDIFSWLADTTTTGPGIVNGDLRWNNATQGSATHLFISVTTYNNINLSAYFAALTIGNKIVIQDKSNPNNTQRWEITAKTDNTTYYDFQVTLVEQIGTNISNNRVLDVGFVRSPAGPAGTVTSVNVSGGTTGLTTSGGPITSSGVITLAGTLGIANGGSGQTTANAALNAFLPSQTGNANKGLVTDGTNTSWQTEYPTGGGTNKVFYENQTNVTANYTITTGYNAMSAGPITVDPGFSVTVPTGSVWTIV